MHANFQDAAWYRAATLRERIATTQGVKAKPQAAENPDVAARRLQRWRSQPPFNEASIFAQRLATDGITEEEFLALLSESPDSLRAGLSNIPPWLDGLSLAFGSDPPPNTALLSDELSKQPAAGLLNLIEPLLAHGLARFQGQAEDLIRQFPDAPLSTATFGAIFLSDLRKQLLGMLQRTLVLELNVGRLEGLLDGATPEDRFRSFTERLLRAEVRLAILHEYPVLARQLAEHIERSSTSLLEFLGRLCADWEEIRHRLSPDKDPGVLVHVEMEAGDRHRNGRSVVICEFGSGFRLAYKPKSMAADSHFQELVKWLNQRGLSPALPLLQILDRDTHGWVEFVAAETCKSEQALSRFYERQGVYLALLYALEATDFHCENLIAVGENPILIDLEAIFQPDPPENPAEDETTRGMIPATVLRVGLLPLRFGANAESEGVDFTGLGGSPGQVTPYRVPRWEKTDTDENAIGAQTRHHLRSAEPAISQWIRRPRL